jgi:peptide deformylase
MQEYTYNTDTLVREQVNLTTNTSTTENFKVEPYKIVLSNYIKDGVDAFDFSSVEYTPEEIACRLIETCTTHKVFGLAANQCGIPLKVFVVGCDDDFVAFFNPEIISISNDIVLNFETDASNPGLMLNIKRAKHVSIQYQDYTGETKLLNCTGITAALIQQNMDRLNNIDFKSKVSQLQLDRSNKALSKKLKKFIKTNIRQGVSK